MSVFTQVEQEKVQIQCPYCKTGYMTSKDRIDKRVQCAKCKKIFTAKLLLASNKEKEIAKVAQNDSASLPAAPSVHPSAPPAPPVPPPPSVTDFKEDFKEDNEVQAKRPVIYKKRQKPRGIKQKIGAGAKNLIGGSKKYVQKMTLKHEARGLHTVIEEQYEKLGVLVLQHRPDKINIDFALEELSQIQEELEQKQMTLDALGKGSGSVAKELKKEIAQYEENQSQLMIKIGRKAEMLKIDMPGSAGYYEALKRLRSSLKIKENELESLGEQVDLAGKKELRISSFKKPLIIAGSALAGILALWMAWSLFVFVITPKEIREIQKELDVSRQEAWEIARRLEELYDMPLSEIKAREEAEEE